MKSTSTLWQAPNTAATNESGFSGLPAGYRNDDGTFYDVGDIGIWCSSSEYATPSAWTRVLNYNDSGAYSYGFSKENGGSVRCLRD